MKLFKNKKIIEELKKEINELQNKHEKEIDDYILRIEDYKNSNLVLNKKIKELKSKLNMKILDNSKISKINEELKKSNEEYSKFVIKANDKIAEKNVIISELNKKCTTLGTSNGGLKSANNKLKNKITSLEKQLKEQIYKVRPYKKQDLINYYERGKKFDNGLNSNKEAKNE